MFTIRKSALKAILSSKNGHHLTSYIENTGTLPDLANQIQETAELARQLIRPVVSQAAAEQFLRPITKLATDKKTLQSFTGNIGVFRTAATFRMVNIPSQVDPITVVADSFHVKPLLRWLQETPEFAIISLRRNICEVYRCSGETKELVEAMPIYGSDTQPTAAHSGLRRQEEAFNLAAMLDECLARRDMTDCQIFLAGERNLGQRVIKYSTRASRHECSVISHADNEPIESLLDKARRAARDKILRQIDSSIREFRFAVDFDAAIKSLAQLARLAAAGRLRKIVVADDTQIFGKIDANTGRMSIHPYQLNHEDDDVLDDLAQRVLAAGGEVIVVPRAKIPEGRAAIGLTNPNGNLASEYAPKKVIGSMAVG